MLRSPGSQKGCMHNNRSDDQLRKRRLRSRGQLEHASVSQASKAAVKQVVIRKKNKPRSTMLHEMMCRPGQGRLALTARSSSCEELQDTAGSCDCCLHGHACYNLHAIAHVHSEMSLHRLCKDAQCTVEEIREALALSPSEVRKMDAFGRTPLFYAIQQCCTTDVIDVVFSAHEDALLEPDCCGDTPLHLLYSPSRKAALLQTVLRRQPSLAYSKTKSFTSQTLLRKICRPWTRVFDDVRSVVQRCSKLQDGWDKMMLTVQAAYRSRHMSDDAPQLHAAMEVISDPILLSHIVEMYPEQAAMVMGTGYPLHHFLQIPHAGAHRVVQKLIRAYPAACHVLHRGRLPINIALSSGYEWTTGIEDIMHANPDALRTIEAQSGLHPFAVALVTRRCPIETAFALLRENPCIRNAI